MRIPLLAMSGLAALLACGGGGGGGGSGVTNPPPGGGGGVLVHAARVTATSGFAFDPTTVSIAANDTIYFTFQGIQHNVKFDTAGNPGDVGNTSSATVKRAFPTAGTYAYHCGIHPSMTGSITVTP